MPKWHETYRGIYSRAAAGFMFGAVALFGVALLKQHDIERQPAVHQTVATTKQLAHEASTANDMEQTAAAMTLAGIGTLLMRRRLDNQGNQNDLLNHQ